MRIFSAIALFVLWIVLSASYELIHIALGAIVASVVIWINPKGTQQADRIVWHRALLYIPWLFVRIMKSGFHVSRLILQPSLPIKPELITHETPLRSDGELVVLGNSITLTPGTITVEATAGKIIVHAIDQSAQEDLLKGRFDEKVGSLFAARENSQ